MRICIIGSAASIHIAKWCSFMIGSGHEVHVLSNFRGVIPRAIVHWLPSKQRYGAVAYLMSLLCVRRLIRMLNPDIVHFHYLGGSLLYGAIVNRPGIIVSPWGNEVYQPGFPFNNMLMRRLFKKSSSITTTSEAMKRYIQKRFGINDEKIFVCSWGVERRFFFPIVGAEKARLRAELEMAPSAFVLLSHRAMAPIYQIEVIVEAFLKLARTKSEILLILLEGDVEDPGKSVKQYRRAIQNRICGMPKVRVKRGFIARQEMANFLKAADVAVSIPRHDQRSSSVLEALATGTFIVLSNLPEYHDLQHDGYSVEILSEATAACLHQALERIIAMSKQEREDIGQINARLIGRHENWEIQAKKIEALYWNSLHHQKQVSAKGLH